MNIENEVKELVKVIVIDDKNHAIKQIKYNLPQNLLNQYEFIHYESFRDYITDTTTKNKSIVFLDYFLDKDKKTSINFINQIEAEILVGFSSWLEFSDVIKEKATESHLFAEVYSVQKIKETLENHQLEKLLNKILI